MKKILATLAGTIAVALSAGACSAVDTQEAKSIAPIATTVKTQPVQLRDLNRLDYYGRPNRSATRPVKPAISAHENHVKLVNAANRAARAKAVRLAKSKAAQAKLAKKVAEHKAVVKKKVKTVTSKVKKVSLSGIAACIAKYESSGNPRAQNPHSTASGLFQFIDGTWNHFGGYARAMYAPVSVQLKKFYIVWDGGRGAGNWVVAPKCGY